jgi:MFS family permease
MNEVQIPTNDRTRPSAAYAWYITGLLMLAYTFSFLDRQILNLMVGPIKQDLGITDFQFSLMAGGAFGLFYTLMGLPLGWLADRFSRKWIITIGLTVWSLMTAACGLSRSFGQLFLTRVGVGVGEATLSPSAYSLLADLFPKAWLPRAMSVYTVGIFIGAGLALVGGGAVVTAVGHSPTVTLPLIGEMRSWQAVFIAVGLPGLLLALWLTSVREPARQGHTEVMPISDIFRLIRSYPRMFSALFLGSGLYSVLGYADTWYPELFIRTWGWNAAHAGRIIGLSSLIAGPLGLIFAGWYSSRMMWRGQPDACLRLTAYGAIAIAIPAAVMPLMPTPTTMALMLLPIKFFVGFPPVLITSALQMVSVNRQRAQLGAIFLFTVGIIGVTAGPIIPAILTDYVFHNEKALRYSLALASGFVGPLAALTLWQGCGELRRRLTDVSTASTTQSGAEPRSF